MHDRSRRDRGPDRGAGLEFTAQNLFDLPAARKYDVVHASLVLHHLPDGAAETKFSGKTLDKAIGVMGTGRNWNTVLKLHAMSKR